ncbi:MAG: hypothetical protein K0R33_3263, partial [Mycobacterium sp.]|nr:hypothetical protein [Mycobacterium sp.]
MPAVDGALLQVAVVTATEDRGGVLCEIQFQHPGHAARQELPVMAHQHHTAAQLTDEALQPGQTVEIQVIGRLVEQHDVEAGQQQCGQPDPRGLPTRQRGHRGRVGPHRPGIQTQVGEHGGQPLLQVRRAGGQPVIESGGIGVGVGGCRIRQRLGRRLHGLGRRGAAGAPGDVTGDGLARDPFVLLGQPPDEGVGGGDADGAAEWLQGAGQNPQQCALARPVGPDDADDIAGCHGQVDVLEQCAMGVTAGHILGDKRCGHRSIVASPRTETGSALRWSAEALGQSAQDEGLGRSGTTKSQCRAVPLCGLVPPAHPAQQIRPDGRHRGRPGEPRLIADIVECAQTCRESVPEPDGDGPVGAAHRRICDRDQTVIGPADE